MNKINQFLNNWENRFGWSSLKKDGRSAVAAMIIPIVSAVFGAVVLVDTIKNRKTANKVEFAIDITAEVMMILGLGILITLSALLISLGKNLKQACCSSGSKSQIIKD